MVRGPNDRSDLCLGGTDGTPHGSPVVHPLHPPGGSGGHRSAATQDPGPTRYSRGGGGTCARNSLRRGFRAHLRGLAKDPFVGPSLRHSQGDGSLAAVGAAASDPEFSQVIGEIARIGAARAGRPPAHHPGLRRGRGRASRRAVIATSAVVVLAGAAGAGILAFSPHGSGAKVTPPTSWWPAPRSSTHRTLMRGTSPPCRSRPPPWAPTSPWTGLSRTGTSSWRQAARPTRCRSRTR